jgi:hypothetical protein
MRIGYFPGCMKVQHFSQFVTDTLSLPASSFQTAAKIKGKKLTWHDPCHLNRHLGIKEQPRQILKSLEEATYIEMPDIGGVVEFGLSEDGKDIEIQVITEATMIFIPAGLYHGPLNFKQINDPKKPILFHDLFFSPEYKRV